MRILVVVEHFPCLSETFVVNQVTGLLDLGHHVEVYPIGKPVAPVVHPDFEKYRLQKCTWSKPEIPINKLHRIVRAFKFLPRCLWRFPRATLQSLNVFRYGRRAANLYLFYSILPFLSHERNFDIIYCQWGDKGALALIWLDQGLVRGRLAVLFHAHEVDGLSDKQAKALYGKLFESAALLLPVNLDRRERLLRWGAKAERTILHHLGVDYDQIPFEPKVINLAAPIQLLSVCRLVEMKGIEYALRAVARIKPRFPVLRYTIVGDGPLRESLENLVCKLGLQETVRFVGPQPHDTVRQLFQTAHIYLLPSVTAANGFKEGLPRVLLEALTGGVPAVATNYAGIPELITDGVSGLLVSERDVAGLANAIERLISSPDFYAAVAKNGRTKVEREFNNRTISQRLEHLFTAEIQK
jgi:colanic acid/amylovoran biosynthesis glycosyltransferase